MIAPPRPPADPDALIAEARERQRRRRLIAAASVTTVAGLVLLVHALLAGSGANGTAAGSAGASLPACRALQLAASFMPGGAAGTTLGGLIVRNTGGATCSLPTERPQVSVTFRGKPLRTVERSWGTESFGRPAHALAPAARAFLEIGWGSCMTLTTTPPSSRYATLRVHFRDGLSMVVPYTGPEGIVSAPGCNGAQMRPAPAILASRFLRLNR